MMTDRPRVVIILGPTGVGKSKCAMQLAEELGGEIVSADSMQVYQYMDIGTAKPTPDERKQIKHHLIDWVTPDQPFHAGLYRALGRKTIDQLFKEGKPIWVVGGTGLYIRALIQGLFTSPKIDPGIREKLKREAQEGSAGALHQRLREVDPATADRLHPHDLFRIIRALEIFDATGVPISFYRDQHRFGERPYRTLKIGLEIERQSLYHRIDQRVDRMIEQGLLQEVRNLLAMGYSPQLKPMQSLGYKQVIQYLTKKIGWEEAITQIKRDTRHYAKRQWTWFKADPEIQWRDASVDRERLFQEIGSFLREGGLKR
ncbi:MAG: tRNA (adenosine(37)-N6)-dimethylallyltransferase MiaA [Desulfobacterales bacterium]|nr:tRNA (adenosine(37)-N6)-dimethylallyltransferase MiaA [Desulfobacterales bacterium]